MGHGHRLKAEVGLGLVGRFLRPESDVARWSRVVAASSPEAKIA